MLRLRRHGTPLLVALVLGVGALGALALHRYASPKPLPPPEVDYDGCSAVWMPGPVCVLEPEKPLRLWVAAGPNAPMEVRVDGNGVDVSSEPILGGRRYSLTLPAGATSLAVHVDRRAEWRLSIASSKSEKPAGARDALAEVREEAVKIDGLIRAGDLSAARQALAAWRLPPRPTAQSRMFVHYFRGWLAEREADYRTALQELQAALEIAERVKLDRRRWQAEQELAVVWRALGRSTEAARIFERLRRHSEAKDDCERAGLLNNQAWSELLGREAGESFGNPTPLLEQALALYETCPAAKAEKKANLLLNLALADLQEKRAARVPQLLTRARELAPHPPLLNRLWSLDLEGRRALLEGSAAAALRSFEEQADLAAQTNSFDGALRARFGEARAFDALGEGDKALGSLGAAEALLDEQSLQIPINEGRETFVAARESVVMLHLELLLARGRDGEALEVARHARGRLLRQLAQLDRLASLPAEKRDERSRLLSEYQSRRALLEARAADDWKLPADERQQEEAARRQDAAAANKLLDAAFLVVGESAARPPEVRPPVRSGELVLTFHPLRSGWVGFAADDRGVAARRLTLAPEELARPDLVASRLLLPFRPQIERAQRLRIVPSGRLEAVDFHALPFAGDALVAARPVVYGLDLGAVAGGRPPEQRRALLVADPRGDLPGAAAESVAVRKVLQSDPRPWIVDQLSDATASADAVRRRLAAAELFHYAGHGSFAGFGGWDSSLLLANKTRLTLGDLLALDKLPRWVVLSGCDTGRSQAEAPVAGLGLAHAFLLAGSQEVVASTRPTDDRSLPVFFAELYRQWQRDPDLAAALQHAQLAWRQRNPTADWASFRVFEP